MSFTLFIDGDAFPNRLKPIVSKAIERHELKTKVISNKRIHVSDSSLIEYQIVDLGPDEADDEIVEQVAPGDFVITADIPLADRVLTKGAHALDHRGKMWTSANIKQALAVRDLMQSLQDTGEITRRGPAAFGPKDAHAFANAFSQFLSKIR